MRAVALVFSCGLILGGLGLSGCTDDDIGQPCVFSWPRNADQTKDCQSYPACAPLQKTGVGGVTVNNEECPVDCIQTLSMQCENLICVATQIEGNTENMNGECRADLVAGSECDADNAPVGCQGYCTKECLSDASCPKGYTCSPMAPFENLNCESEALWGTECTSSCVAAGQSPAGTGVQCPSSVEGETDYGYTKCEGADFATCCSCICYRFCSLVSKKFCRKTSWDQDLFPGATTTATDCKGGTGE